MGVSVRRLIVVDRFRAGRIGIGASHPPIRVVSDPRGSEQRAASGEKERARRRRVHDRDYSYTNTNANTFSAFAFAFVGEREGMGGVNIVASPSSSRQM